MQSTNAIILALKSCYEINPLNDPIICVSLNLSKCFLQIFSVTHSSKVFPEVFLFSTNI